MELRQLRYAVTLADTLHFGRAAEREYIAQSTFSQQIARLEHELGVLLFDRNSKRVSPTAAGELFVRHARQILAALAAMESEVRASTTLRVGVFAEGAGELTPLIFQAFRDTYPGTALHIVELSFADQVERLATGDVDVAILRPPLSDPRLALRVLFAEPCFVGLPVNHPAATTASLSVADLDGERCVDATASPVPWNRFWRYDEAAPGSPPARAVASGSVAESLAAIGYLGAVDIFPASATRRYPHPGVAYVPLRDHGYACVAVAHRRGDTRALVREFGELAAKVSRDNLDVVPLAVPPEHAPPGTPLPDPV
ncbi:LysR substrate-binding domain-containing protein [Pseudonocardia acaciae]|uniref:LysR substrate-binding domain-containing protein n=1 Tax=Pseudonocardia acaciae TaxID=551276 RepID=UPI000ACF022E|nr:LysR substrate-binding domain-containing protein [Pseudonocardia acaciae]